MDTNSTMSFWTWLRSPVNTRGQMMDLLVFLANLFLLGPFARLLGRLGAGFTANDDAAARQLAFDHSGRVRLLHRGCNAQARAAARAASNRCPSPEYAGCLFLGWISLHLSLSILGAAVIAAGFEPRQKAFRSH